MIVDLPLSELEKFKPPLTVQPDFTSFWQETLAESAAQPLNISSEEYPYVVKNVRVSKVRYDGFGHSTRVVGWHLVPDASFRIVDAEGKTPTIVIYHGYSAGKGFPAYYLNWAIQGYNVFTVDTRGQDGETPDNNIYSSGSVIGFMTKGLLHPREYYYRFTYMDCVRAIDAVRTFPETGPIIVTGGSQGGGLTIAVAALAREQGIVAAMPDIPFLCSFPRAIEVSGGSPYQELANYWKSHPYDVEQSERTLSYFDGMNLGTLISCPTLISVGLLDSVCPPSTAFAVYNHLTCEKEIKVYPYMAHEVTGHHEEIKFSFARKYFRLD